MNEVRTLMEKHWICKDSDKETYYKIKRDIPKFRKFVRDQLGWRLIHTEKLIKLEKIPSKAEPFMGISQFSEIRDYVIFCACLMYLEDTPEGEQFLLSELIDFITAILTEKMEVDWTSFSQRKSLVRVLQYMEELEMVKVYDGNAESFGHEENQEVLYINTGYSKYFSTSFPFDISEFESWKDFEKKSDDIEENQRIADRVHRIYRGLVINPAMYFQGPTDTDLMYIKNQRQRIEDHLNEHLDGRLDVHRNAAFWMIDGNENYGNVHPRDNMLSEIVMLVCTLIGEKLAEGIMGKNEKEEIHIKKEDFATLVMDCKRAYSDGWTKEYKEMDEDRLVKRVAEYMENWLMLKLSDGASIGDKDYVILPGAGKVTAIYPENYK